MREIKFRAWDKKCIEVYGTGMSYGEPEYFDDMLAFRFNHFESDNPSDIIYEQFTGLIDKKGKEIYEGDIVSTEARNHGKGIEVRFHNSSWHGFYRELRFILTEGELLEEYIVIGNIHENPELLK